jgi:uncharacterized protein (TIGR02145 family)
MKNNILLIFGMVLTIDIAQAQNDTMYIMKSGNMIDQYKITEIDSVIFYKPTIPAGTTVTDFDGNVYNTVTIGTQVWMAENLKVVHYADGTDLANGQGVGDILVDDPTKYWFVYKDKIANKTPYGLFYTWRAAMNGAPSSSASPSGVKGVCPDGWHMPSDAEWTTLENYIIANGYNYDGTTTGNKIAKALASTISWALSSVPGSVGNSDFPYKRNITGFTALSGGGRGNDGVFYYIGNNGYWWSSTSANATQAYARYMDSGFINVGRDDNEYDSGLSVRCVKD